VECHPVCDLFPPMGPDEFQELCTDIAKRGQLVPIWTYQDQIIDGRNRYRACCRFGIAPKFQEWDGRGSLVEFVVSLNMHRRHLTPGQKAKAAAAALPLLEKEGQRRMSEGGRKAGRNRPSTKGSSNLTNPIEPATEKWDSREEAARMFGVSTGLVTMAEQVKRADPEAFEAIGRGEVSVHAAKQRISGNAKPKTPPVAYINLGRVKDDDATIAARLLEVLGSERLTAIFDSLAPHLSYGAAS
jgi:hypothetical protein